ncbi:MAG: hypothetical protein ACFBWO_10555 [Paracoccaceae bacterium]
MTEHANPIFAAIDGARVEHEAVRARAARGICQALRLDETVEATPALGLPPGTRVSPLVERLLVEILGGRYVFRLSLAGSRLFGRDPKAAMLAAEIVSRSAGRLARHPDAAILIETTPDGVTRVPFAAWSAGIAAPGVATLREAGVEATLVLVPAGGGRRDVRLEIDARATVRARPAATAPGALALPAPRG